MQLFAHPFSSYCQKVLIALYENAIPFEFRMLSPDHEQNMVEHAELWPLKRMPVLVDGDRTVLESSIIIEYLDIHYPGTVRWLPESPDAALDVRLLDRFFDQYVMTPMQRIVFDFIRAEAHRDAFGVAEAHKQLETAYAWLEQTLPGREWAAGSDFTLADCAAAPSLFYADWVHPIPADCANLRAYRSRLLARPSFARAVEDARPYRGFFPPGAPDRD
ncbi:glutathione S-transferase family protein [Cupriavidus necator]|uniref:glutathione S-transferase family protein n=1 Tax=Cupriavidus necator TaxID=106590 RepID=UPI0005B3FD70|nr:glutathione S-transferase family protein [Cupriavidus necator]